MLTDYQYIYVMAQIFNIYFLISQANSMRQAIFNKRQAFRNQIRHKQLESYFANKRKLLVNQMMEIEHHTFKNIYQHLQQHKDIDQNLLILSGLSFDRQLWQQFEDPNRATQLYYELILLLIKLIQEYKDRQKQASKRIVCLNIISNMLADKQCPNPLLAEAICNFLKQFYESVSYWGFDKQMVEVGCLLANLINKQNFMQETNQNETKYILEWLQELLHIKQQNEMSVFIYFALSTAVRSFERKYHLQEYQLPELYLNQFINYIQITLFNDSIFKGSSALLQRAYAFINQMIPTLLTMCPYLWCQRLVKNIFSNLGSLKRMQFNHLCSILLKMITLRGIQCVQISQNRINRAIETRNNIRNFIVQNYQNKMIVYLTTLQFEAKEKIFQIIVRLIQCDELHASFYLQKFVEIGLENWMIKNFQVNNNSELEILFFQMVNLANELKMQNCFKTFIEYSQVKKGMDGHKK